MWIIGDIHGCQRELNLLLKKLPSEDKLIFLGDYIDRGPDSKSVITRLVKESGRSVFLSGNHEEMMLSYFKREGSGDSGLYWTISQNGGDATMHSYGFSRDSVWNDLPEDHRYFLENLQLYYEDKNFLAVHAGVKADGPENLSKQNKNDLLWIRSDWIKNESQWKGKHVYYGHTPSYMLNLLPLSRLIEGKKSTGLDTGCVYGGFLTAYNPESGEIIQVENAG